MKTSETGPQFHTESSDLEIKDARLIFNSIWDELEEIVGHDKLRFPKEIILLGGAPGSGKGTQTRFISEARGLTCPPIVVSDLLTSPAAQSIKDQGGMVGDREVINILFRKILEEEFRDGVILDGFPRTRTQVECLKHLVNKIYQLHQEFSHTQEAVKFRKPIIHVMVLFVTEQTSIDRQLKRGRSILLHNQEVEESGVGQIIEVRETDLQGESARRRYKVFKEKTWGALESLKEIYHYHFINAEGPIDEVEENILHELQYQSSLELETRTFDRLRPLPIAEEIITHARQELVKRLDSYEIQHTDLFIYVVELIRDKFMAVITRHALSGRAIVNSEDAVLDNPLAISMLIDIFSERGYHAVVDKDLLQFPVSVDLQTGAILNQTKRVFRISISFKGSDIRRG